MRLVRRLVKWLLGSIVILLIAVAAPILYVETACRANLDPAQTYTPLITDPAWQRPEARTFLTFPEWQIVYAYEELAGTLAKGDEHEFGYLRSIAGFWTSYCAMNREADARGGADGATRSMIYVIGSSFDLELALKALYEETLGRIFVALRGSEKTPQDRLAADMAADYGRFLHQTPWYRYPFAEWSARLWAAPLDEPIRGWERRLALGGEWWAKRQYARAIEQAVAASGKDKLRIRSVVSGLTPEQLGGIDGVTVVGAAGTGSLIETNRYAEYTTLLRRLAAAGGDLVEIAGNDDIMVSVLHRQGLVWPAALGRVLSKMDRQGSEEMRSLVLAKVTSLAELVRRAPSLGVRIEHVYDY